MIVKIIKSTKRKYNRLVGKKISVSEYNKLNYLYKTDKKNFIIKKSDCELIEVLPPNKITVDDNLELEDQVNHPVHYGGAHNKYEAIKVIEALNMDFHLGNTFKYIARAGVKSKDTELEDLQKAAWYLNRKIENLKKHKK